jgi:hypothetical protein
MKSKTKERIWDYLEGFMQGLVNKYDPKVIKREILKKQFFDEKKGEYKPFHMALIPEEFLRIQSFFRSFSTSLGQGVFEYIAKIIAEDSGLWQKVKRNERFYATASPNIQAFIDDYLEKLEKRIIKPSKNVKFPKPSSDAKKSIVVDLYLRRDEIDYFIEIKSPKPNKDQTRRTKEKFLYLKASPWFNAVTFYAFPYNPYGEVKSNYKWSFTTMFFDLNSEVLIGKEFWDFLGGENTYEKLLKLFRKFGEERGKDIVRKLIA